MRDYEAYAFNGTHQNSYGPAGDIILEALQSEKVALEKMQRSADLVVTGYHLGAEEGDDFSVWIDEGFVARGSYRPLPTPGETPITGFRLNAHSIQLLKRAMNMPKA